MSSIVTDSNTACTSFTPFTVAVDRSSGCKALLSYCFSRHATNIRLWGKVSLRHDVIVSTLWISFQSNNITRAVFASNLIVIEMFCRHKFKLTTSTHFQPEHPLNHNVLSTRIHSQPVRTLNQNTLSIRTHSQPEYTLNQNTPKNNKDSGLSKTTPTIKPDTSTIANSTSRSLLWSYNPRKYIKNKT